jgi:hypothetical protein
MARIKLRRRECNDPPMICMMCGEPAVERLGKRFSWHPPWVIALIIAGLLPYVLVAMSLNKKMRVKVAVCERHIHYWRNKFFVFFGSFLALCVLSVGWLVFAFVLDEEQHVDLGGLICGLPVVGVIIWLTAIFVLQQLAMRPVEITDRSITFLNVSPEFADAVEDDREDRAKRRERDDGGEDEQAPRRRSRRESEY